MKFNSDKTNIRENLEERGHSFQRTRCSRGRVENSTEHRTAGSFGEHGDHSVALWWSGSLLGMLSTVDLILHKEMTLLFQIGAVVGAHVTLRVAVEVPQLHKHTDYAGAMFVIHERLLGISSQCSHFGDWSLNTSESWGLVGIPCLLGLQDFLQNQE